MAPQAVTTGETVEGVVEARNDTGIRVNGDWRNRSRFKPVELPDVGTLVRLGVDAKGYITALEVLEAETKTLSMSVSTSTRDRRIARLAVLKAAAAFCGQYATVHEEVRSSDVLKIADAWLAWVEA